jgi:hypothetical protein
MAHPGNARLLLWQYARWHVEKESFCVRERWRICTATCTAIFVMPRDTGLGERRHAATLPHDFFGIVNNCRRST